jgi:hypothetical protein
MRWIRRGNAALPRAKIGAGEGIFSAAKPSKTSTIPPNSPKPIAGKSATAPSVGQYLARIELQSFFRELLDGVDHSELAETPRFVEGSFVGGVKYLPIRYHMR